MTLRISPKPSWRHAAIQLLPRNKAFRAIWINPNQVDELRVIAEMVRVISTHDC